MADEEEKTVFTQEDILSMSDEEILNLDHSSIDYADPPKEGDTATEENEDETSEEKLEDSEDNSENVPDDDAEEEEESEDENADKLERPEEDEPSDETEVEEEKPKKTSDKEEADAEKVEPKEFDYKGAYNEIMKPFKANGKQVKLDSPEEVIKLMQMGANYTKKLQALQPGLRVLKMLENNGLMNEGKLSYLIDLDKKDPEAVKKFIKESGIDPIEIDTSEESNYRPGNHRVSDEEMNFVSALEEVGSSEAGKDIIVNINKTWDAQSKDTLWKDPNLLKILATQKENGIYDQISNEVERKKMLGELGPSVPFIQSYYQVGQELEQAGKLKASTKTPSAETTPASEVIASRTVQKKRISNNDKAKAAAATPSTRKSTKQDFNPLAMSDEEFQKSLEFSNKL